MAFGGARRQLALAVASKRLLWGGTVAERVAMGTSAGVAWGSALCTRGAASILDADGHSAAHGRMIPCGGCSPEWSRDVTSLSRCTKLFSSKSQPNAESAKAKIGPLSHLHGANGVDGDGNIAMQQQESARGKVVLYKGRWMVPFYILVRLKVFQLLGFGSLVVPLNTWLVEVARKIATQGHKE
eukprot:evm.model.scf_1129.4 EVM.evm.TU.scf_1129.4   scf_1129:21786-23242(+)